MKHRVELYGNDGTFLIGGNPLHTVFECNDDFLDHCIGMFGGGDIDYLMHETGEEISMFLYADVDMCDETAQELGFLDADSAWEAKHPEGVYHYIHEDESWKIRVDCLWGMQDSLALTTGAAITPHLHEALTNRLAARA